MRMPSRLLVITGAAVIAGCSGGARDVDYDQERSISADIDATHQTGPQLLKHGQVEHDEPYDAFPWRLGERRQGAE